MRFILIIFLGFAWLPFGTGANETLSGGDLHELLSVKIRTVQHMALNPTLVRAVRHQNAADLNAEEIAQRDRAWQQTNEITQFKWSLQQSKAGRLLRRHVEGNPSINEAFLTDQRGANVAAFPATSCDRCQVALKLDLDTRYRISTLKGEVFEGHRCPKCDAPELTFVPGETFI